VTTKHLPTGLYFWNDDKVRCEDCQRWAYEGETIRHSSRCDTSTLQAASQHVAQTAKHNVVTDARAGTAYANGHDEDDLLLAVRCGALSVSDAMNQDF
jgi:hypothetical protein